MSNTIKLKLRNFRRLAHTEEILFRPGLTIISGPNGAGKTTLTESLIYAFFGPGLKKGRGLNDILTDNTVGKTLVECEVMIDRQVVKIVRTGKLAELWVNGIQVVDAIPSSARVANQQIQRLLGGLDRTQFERVYVALQGDTAGLVDEDPKKRYDIIERVLQLDVLGKALELQKDHKFEKLGSVQAEGNAACQNLQLDEQARSFLAQFRAALKLPNRMEHAQKFLQRVDQTVTSLQKQKDETLRQQNETQTMLEALIKRIAEQDTICKAEKQKCDDCDLLQVQHQGFATKIAKLEGQLTEIQSDIKQQEEAIAASEQYAEAAREYQQLSTSISVKEQRLQQLPHVKTCFQLFAQSTKKEAEFQRRLLTFADVDGNLIKAQNEVDRAKQRYEVLSQDDSLYLEDLQTWLQADALLTQMEKQNTEALDLLATNSTDATCPTCNQHFIEHTPEQRIQHLQHWLQHELPQQRTQMGVQKAQLDQRAERRKHDQEDARQVYLQSQTSVERCKSTLKERDLIREQYTAAQVEREQAQNVWSELKEATDYDPSEEATIKEALKGLRQNAENLVEKSQQYDRLPLLRQTVEEKRKTSEEYTRKREQIVLEQTQLGYQPEQHQAIKKAMQEAQEHLAELREQHTTAQQDFNEAKNAHLAARQAVAIAIDHHDRFETSVQEYYKEDRLYTLLDEFKKHFFEANTREVFA
ncbi:MAG TPA: SMC family ATPase, partial [Ktedonobacteraceae bacterium]|nr:SMC family ATPase [Ktedonobacteraceae bacterium]